MVNSYAPQAYIHGFEPRTGHHSKNPTAIVYEAMPFLLVKGGFSIWKA